MKRFTLLLVALCFLLFSTSVAYASSTVSKIAGFDVLPGIDYAVAYGGLLQVPAGFNLASIGPLSAAALGCDTSAKTSSSSANSMTLGSFASSGAATATVTAGRTATRASTQASATIDSVNILNGLITASAVNAVVSSQSTSASSSSSNNSTFSNLTVAGVPILFTPGPNTTLPLPGLGNVVLNEQIGPIDGADATSITVTAIDVSVTVPNTLGLPTGTHILLAHTESSFQRTAVPAVVGANSYGLHAFGQLGLGFADSGPLASAAIGCTGGSQTTSLAGATVPNIGTTGRMIDMASGQIASSGSTTNSSSTVTLVNLLSGIITADNITVNAYAAFLQGTGTASATTTLTNAKVSGNPVPGAPTPNMKIPIANLGYVVLNEQASAADSTGAVATVNALDLYVTTSNSFGLPVGAQIIVGHSGAVVSGY
jgi:hypothetical protein